MKMPRFQFPKFCLSTILIEIGILCALVAVNTRPLSYGIGSELVTNPLEAMEIVSTLPDWKATHSHSNYPSAPWAFDEDDLSYLDDYRVANYDWPLTSVEVTTKAHQAYVDKQNLAANIAICLAIIVVSAIAIEWSVRYARRKRVPPK